MAIDTYTVKTTLRPDYHELAPLFGRDELLARARYLSFDQATLLQRPNIREYCRQFGILPYLRYLRRTPGQKARMLQTKLERVGFPVEISRAVASVNRVEVVPAAKSSEAFLDQSIRVHGETYLSAPTLVAYMLNEFRFVEIDSNATIVEIGSGTGHHLRNFSQVYPRRRLIGLEISADACRIASKLLNRPGIGQRVDVKIENASALSSVHIAQAQYVYATAALSLSSLSRLQHRMRQGAYWTVARQLYPEEFYSEPAASWLRQYFKGYSAYLSGGWRKFLALETAHIEDPSRRVILNTMYDLSFVALE